MDNYQEDLASTIKTMFKDIKDTDLSDFYHMNKYGTVYDDRGILINYTIPGADADGLSIKIRRDILYVEAKKGDMFNGLKDAIGIPANVSIEGITSKYKNGVLLIRMPYLTKKDDRDQIEIVIE